MEPTYSFVEVVELMFKGLSTLEKKKLDEVIISDKYKYPLRELKLMKKIATLIN